MNDFFEKQTEDFISIMKFLSDFIRAGIDASVKHGSLVEEVDGFCFYCEKSKPVYNVSEDFPSQPATCDSCLYQRSLMMVSEQETLERIVNALRQSKKFGN